VAPESMKPGRGCQGPNPGQQLVEKPVRLGERGEVAGVLISAIPSVGASTSWKYSSAKGVMVTTSVSPWNRKNESPRGSSADVTGGSSGSALRSARHWP
jgi:hypothetical protein